ncbi:MAG: hypothetical protein GY936_13450 [Ignavibacteriae bacterium]|nr:hypothetical protein [Ignavibacteriota bacterium]
MNKILNKNILFFLLFLATNIFAQTINDSLNFSLGKYQSKTFRTSFGKRLNTHNLLSLLSYSVNENNFFLGIKENYYSSLVTSQTNSIKDEQALSIIGEYTFSPFLQAGVFAQNNIYSDDRKIAINQASTIYTTLYAKYSPLDQIRIIPFGGLAVNRQVNENDKGIIYGSEISVDRLSVSDFLITSNIKFMNEEISPRKNTQQMFSTQIKNHFDHSLTNIISADYSNKRKDFYFDVDSITAKEFDITNNIQSRIEKFYSFEERLFSSRFTSDIFFDLSARVSLRDIDRATKYTSTNNLNVSNFDSNIEELRLDFSGTTEYRSRAIFARMKFDFSERDEKHIAKSDGSINPIIYEQRTELEKRRNNTSQYATLSILSNFAVSDKDNITFSILHRKLIYDTPSKNNFDDRDELLSILRTSYFHNFNHLFNFFVSLEGSVNHIVYILSERSSNNNFRRILKLTSGGEFKTDKIYSKNSFEVSANYTSYDFQDINPNIRSFSFRQFAARDSSSIRLFNKLHFDVSGYAKLSEQGDFNWASFANSPDRFLAEFYTEPMLNIRTDAIKIGFGFRFFLLQTFNYNTNNLKYKHSEYKSLGPITNLKVSMPNLEIYLYGWYEFISNEKYSQRELANLSFSVNWRL